MTHNNTTKNVFFFCSKSQKTVFFLFANLLKIKNRTPIVKKKVNPSFCSERDYRMRDIIIIKRNGGVDTMISK
jgi:hypothetical protein